MNKSTEFISELSEFVTEQISLHDAHKRQLVKRISVVARTLGMTDEEAVRTDPMLNLETGKLIGRDEILGSLQGFIVARGVIMDIQKNI